VRFTAVGKKSMVARTLGHRRDSLGQRGTMGDGEARSTIEWVGGGRGASVDDELIGEEAAAEETLVPGIGAGSLSSQQQHWVEDVEVVLLLGVGSDGRPCGSQ
jgi:hypothetical protein